MADARTILGPLDHVRAGLLRTLMPALRPFMVSRDLRVVTTASLLVPLGALSSVLIAPWMLVLGPLLWGPVHVLSDLRYLVARRGDHRRWIWWAGVGAPLVLATILPWPLVGLSAVVGAAIIARGVLWRRALVLMLAGLAMGGFGWLEGAAYLGIVHLHNLVALAIWWTWRPRRALHLLPLALYALAMVALCTPAAMTLAFEASQVLPPPPGLSWEVYQAWLAPGVSGRWALPLVLTFAFAQGQHYVVWVRLIPEDDRPQRTPRPFFGSYRALKRDLGGWVLWAVALVNVGLVGFAVLDLAGARALYLRLIVAHAYLELAAAALFFVEGRVRPKELI